MVESIFPLALRNASVKRKGKVLVGPIDLELGSNAATAIIGPNGAGKTSLLRLMHGLERCDSGSVQWAIPDEEARKRQSFVFQTPIIMRRTVLECIAYPLAIRGAGKGASRNLAAEWGERVGLKDVLRDQAAVLSGGEKQKLALARALVTAPEVLFLDEPCANLDGRATREIEGILSDAVSAGTRIVMATHDMGQARRISNEVLFLYKGRLHEIERTELFFPSPRTSEAAAFLRGDILE
ncbi:MAG: ATP-binding cassette domain-containing protein [Albidovulum sp.]|nr:ATP-binding cassette domain-containing protein [Albidovulum sp.]MDE0533116.1 ATP-binding cassette domain-containing protein [Albidovulum sp.]